MGNFVTDPRADIPRTDGSDRLAVYVVAPGNQARDEIVSRRRIAETSVDGLGLTLITLFEEHEFDGVRVGVFDRSRREWIISPWSGR
jgi:hypothetical protein